MTSYSLGITLLLSYISSPFCFILRQGLAQPRVIWDSLHSQGDLELLTLVLRVQENIYLLTYLFAVLVTKPKP